MSYITHQLFQRKLAYPSLYLVDKAQRDPTATTYFAGPHPTYANATGRGLFSSSI